MCCAASAAISLTIEQREQKSSTNDAIPPKPAARVDMDVWSKRGGYPGGGGPPGGGAG